MYEESPTRNVSKEKIILICKGCQKKIATICKTQHNQKSWDIQAKCPFCTEYSSHILINGEFFYSGYSKYHDQDTQDDIPVTMLHDIEVNDNKITIILAKA